MMRYFRLGLAGLACLLALAAPAQQQPPRFTLGISPQAVLQILGKPTALYPPDQDGRTLLYYNRATVTLLKNQVIAWRNFDERMPPWEDGMPTVSLGATEEEVLNVLGFPPNAMRYTGLVLGGRKPIGEEEWSYSVGTLIFKDHAVVGWRNVTTPAVSIGTAAEEAVKEPGVGGTAREVIAALGTPPMLTCYVASGDQLWGYPHEQVLLRDGTVVWKGVPQPKTKADLPPVRTEAPATGTPENGETPKKDEKGFINEPAFAEFRISYQHIMDRMQQNNSRIVNTASFRAMQDCLAQRPWWAIQAQADNDPDYAKGVDALQEAYEKYLDERDRRNR